MLYIAYHFSNLYDAFYLSSPYMAKLCFSSQIFVSLNSSIFYFLLAECLMVNNCLCHRQVQQMKILDYFSTFYSGQRNRPKRWFVDYVKGLRFTKFKLYWYLCVSATFGFDGKMQRSKIRPKSSSTNWLCATTWAKSPDITTYLAMETRAGGIFHCKLHTTNCRKYSDKS